MIPHKTASLNKIVGHAAGDVTSARQIETVLMMTLTKRISNTELEIIKQLGKINATNKLIAELNSSLGVLQKAINRGESEPCVERETQLLFEQTKSELKKTNQLQHQQLTHLQDLSSIRSDAFEGLSILLKKVAITKVSEQHQAGSASDVDEHMHVLTVTVQ